MILNIYYQFRIILSYIKNSDAYRRLEKRKYPQKQQFRLLVKNFSNKYKEIENFDDRAMTIKQWRYFNEKLKSYFLPKPSFNFLRNQLILRTMFVTTGGVWLKKELNYLESNFSKRTLNKTLSEDLVGKPILLNTKYTTSHNSINHLYHIVRFLNSTGSNITDIKTVVEWGGGYGSMAKIFKRLNATKITYIIIDTPLFSCLQWLYLSTIFGEKDVHLIKRLPIKIIAGKINILPVGLAKNLNIKTDLFVSTWALSESSVAAQNLVIKKQWYGAKKILLGFQTSSKNIPYANNLASEIKKKDGKIEPIDFLPGNFYGYLNHG